jgi:hypothetical protein
LWECAQETGKDWFVCSGPEELMRKRMETDAARNRDVWLIAPDGTKHLPAVQAPAVAHELTDLELERLFCERVGLDSINPAAFDTRRACRWFINGYRASQNPAAQARSDALEEAVEALEPLKARWLPNVCDVYVVGECAAAIRALVAKRPAHPKQIAGIGCALCGRNEAGYYCTGDCGEYQDAAASQPPVQPQGGA